MGTQGLALLPTLSESTRADGAAVQGLAAVATADGYAVQGTEGGLVDGFFGYSQPTTGEPVRVDMEGIVGAISGAAFSRGVFLMADTDGKVILYVAAGGKFKCAQALDAATGADQAVRVRPIHGGVL